MRTIFDGYLELANQEAINTTRAQVYAENAGLFLECEDCPDLPEAVGDKDGYVDVVTDPAPWYDPASPESGSFYGVIGLGMSGFNSSTVTREVTDLIGDGAIVGVPRSGAREMAFTVALLARDQCALDFGLEYLAFVLSGSAPCDGACRGDQLCLFSCCPGTYPGAVDGGPGDAEIRHLYDVALLEGPTLSSVEQVGDVLVGTVTFTLVAGNPYIYRDPIEFGGAQADEWLYMTDGRRVNNLDPDEILDECPEPPDCLDDGSCEAPALPPAPPLVVDPCYPSGPDDWWQQRFGIGIDDQPKHLEAVPLIEFETGTEALERAVFRFWLNPQALDCDRLTDPCQACIHISVGYLPARSRLTIDGRTRSALVECPDPATRQSSWQRPRLYGPQGQSHAWPVFECPTVLCVEVLTQYATTSSQARVRASVVPRSKVG